MQKQRASFELGDGRLNLRKALLLASVAVALALTACGGGGPTGPTTPCNDMSMMSCSVKQPVTPG